MPEIKQGPFSLYDFIGYFVPGALAIHVFVYVFEYMGMDTGLTELVSLTRASQFLPFLLAAYVAGHLIALLSSFTIERYFIWQFDYPSKSLLRYPERKFLGEPGSRPSFADVVKILLWVLMLPVSAVISSLCFFSVGRPGFVSSLDPLLTEIIRRKIARLMVDRGQVDNPNNYDGPRTSDFFRLVYHYTIENSPAHFAKIQNYVALFGFNRAMCLLFVMTFWVAMTSLLVQRDEHSFCATIVSAILANMFFFGFSKFYRRFNLEALMAFSISYVIPDHLMKIDFVENKKRKKVGATPRDRSHFSTFVNDLRGRVRIRRDR